MTRLQESTNVMSTTPDGDQPPTDEATPSTRRLEPGDEAPDFVLPDSHGHQLDLPSFRGSRVVLYFYPAAGTPGCTEQACDFQAGVNDFEGAGLQVVGISPDTVPQLAAFRDSKQLTFPLLSDPGHAVLSAYGAWGEKTLSGRRQTGVIRSTVVVGPNGRVEKAFYDVTATGHVARLRRELGLADA